MSSLVSLEIYRPVLSIKSPEDTEGDDFIERATTMAQLLFNRNGNSVVTLRTDNVVRPTIIQAARGYSTHRYVHARLVGVDTKHLAKKTFTMRNLMAEGASNKTPSLSERMGEIAVNGFGLARDVLLYDVELSDTDIVTQQTKDGNRQFLVLRPGQEIDRDENSDNIGKMLQIMSNETHEYIHTYANERVKKMVMPSIRDIVPIARIESSETDKAEMLESHIRELLPVVATVSAEVAFDFSS